MSVIVVGSILLTFAFLLIVPLGFLAITVERRRRAIPGSATKADGMIGGRGSPNGS